MNHQRLRKVQDQIQQELALLIQREVKDPGVGFVTISAVKISKDFSYADILVSVLPKHRTPFDESLSVAESADTSAELEVAEAMVSVKALVKASGFLRSSLAKTTQLRVVPRLRFHLDDALIRGHALSALIESAVSTQKTHID